MYYNRDLSWLGFNERVLQEAADKTIPLFERIKFLSIFSSNLDEFFSVRYPILLAISQLKTKTQKKLKSSDGTDLPEKAQLLIERLLIEYGNILKQDILPDLIDNGIKLYYNETILPQHIAEVRELFLSEVLSFVQPVFLRTHAEKKIDPESNKLYMVITLRNTGAGEIQHTLVKIPSDILPRFYELSGLDGMRYFISIDDVIRENIQCIFPGFEIHDTYSIKFNRDAEIDLDDDYSGDILKKIERKVNSRASGRFTRFLYEADMPRNIQLFLASYFNIEHDEMFAGSRYHNFKDLASLPVSDASLSYKKITPLSAISLMNCGDIFNTIEQKDILLHFPYQSYNPILTFFNQAAIDPEVDEIYIALYRVASQSLIVNALISAAKNGKKVTAFVELKARFDETNNINWSRRMEDAGVKIIYSIPNIKVHSKIALVRKREDLKKKSYSIISTGNFNEVTAKFYTDHTILTADTDIASDLLTLFQYLQKRQKPHEKEVLEFKTLLTAHFNMVDSFEKLIKEEIKKAKKKQPARIRIKLNNLEETHMIGLLYEASKAGVKIELIVRSICSLMPGLKDISENITVRRIVDRYLEHSRIFIFGTDERAKVFIGSADWMTRNLHHRIEVCTPVKSVDCKEQLIEYYDLQWKDSDKAVQLTPGMDQVRLQDEDERFNAQAGIYEYLKNRA